MGVVHRPRTKMRAFVLLSVAFLLASFFTPMDWAKGGAKSAMNRRGKSKDSGRRGQGAGREDDDEDIGGQGDKSVPYASRPCVGLCYILKMKSLKTKGIKPKQLEVEVENMRKRRPCIGLCHLNRVAKAKGLPGFLWKHPKQEAKERKEEEREEKKERERLEKEKKKKAKTVETGKEMS